MPSRTIRLLMALLALTLLLVGCGGGGGGDDDDDTNEPNPPSISVAVAPSTVTVSPGATRTFTAAVSNTTDGRVTWSATRGTITAAGLFTAPSTSGTATIRATSVADPTKSGTATVSVRTGIAQGITITPPDATILGGATQQFTATATGFSNSAVTWTATGGTVSSTGLYTAPSVAGTYVVRATSVADPTFGAEARVTVTNSLSISPATARVGTNETLQFTASQPSGPPDVIWSASAGTISSSGLFRAPANAGSVTITATLRSDPTRTVSVTVTVATIAVTITPATATVERGKSFDFDATVTNATTSDAVTWTASAGTIDANGLFTAPASGTTATVTARSVADPARSATATVSLVAALPDVTVVVGPAGLQFSPGGSGDFDADVVGTSDTTVTWTATGGTVDTNGGYVAGATTGTFEVRATSVANPNRSAAVNVKIDAIPVNVLPRTARITRGASVQFTATVGGAGAGGGVTWSATGGTISSSGVFSANAPGTYTVTATSRTNTGKSNTATVVVTS